jgi:predicted nucleotidyltransferase
MNSILNKCNRILSDYYCDKFQGLILYGSMARGQGDNFSDIDLLVLLKEPFNYFQELRKIVELLYPVQLESENLISAKPAAKEEFESGELLLYRLAKREGLAA